MQELHGIRPAHDVILEKLEFRAARIREAAEARDWAGHARHEEVYRELSSVLILMKVPEKHQDEVKQRMMRADELRWPTDQQQKP